MDIRLTSGIASGGTGCMIDKILYFVKDNIQCIKLNIGMLYDGADIFIILIKKRWKKRRTKKLV